MDVRRGKDDDDACCHYVSRLRVSLKGWGWGYTTMNWLYIGIFYLVLVIFSPLTIHVNIYLVVPQCLSV
jgi:hypothetical protein